MRLAKLGLAGEQSICLLRLHFQALLHTWLTAAVDCVSVVLDDDEYYHRSATCAARYLTEQYMTAWAVHACCHAAH